jgi:hypothetical protein
LCRLRHYARTTGARPSRGPVPAGPF